VKARRLAQDVLAVLAVAGVLGTALAARGAEHCETTYGRWRVDPDTGAMVRSKRTVCVPAPSPKPAQPAKRADRGAQ
jgi:hypothetical protein